MSVEVKPFRCEVSDAVIADLKTRLARTRFPDQLDGAGWDYGAELSYVEALCAYWRDTFDWRAAEARFNRFPQFTTELEGETVAFYHIRSPEPAATPLIITHGWPGSVAEFLDILGPLSDPARHGGDPRDAFNVVAPSIPGYGFSGPTRHKGFNAQKAAAVNHGIMERLGYGRFIAQGGDWGSTISSWMALQKPERLIGLHINLIMGRPADPADPLAGLNEEERATIARAKARGNKEAGYQAIQGTKPQSLAYGLTDSPAGLAGWIVEKFRSWSDCHGDIENSFTKDQLLENIMLYWVTGTINSANRMYYEGIGPSPRPRITVPTGHARFPGEGSQTPRLWAEQAYNIVRWEQMPKGGHFAAMEQPAIFVDEVRAFARQLR